jgi:hypothetical protein
MLNKFLLLVQKDDRITVWHVSVYAALVYYWEAGGCQTPASITRREVMQVSHIGSFPTYHKYMRELVEFGFIKYLPSYNPFLGSLVWLEYF